MAYADKALLFKALGDPIRLEIVDMISCNDLCACEILERFDVTQPTLSHHIKILCDCGLVNGRRDGKWTYYSLNEKAIQDVQTVLAEITSRKEACIRSKKSCCGGECE
jgi:ArsR family transcriptional regulator